MNQNKNGGRLNLTEDNQLKIDLKKVNTKTSQNDVRLKSYKSVGSFSKSKVKLNQSMTNFSSKLDINSNLNTESVTSIKTPSSPTKSQFSKKMVVPTTVKPTLKRSNTEKNLNSKVSTRAKTPVATKTNISSPVRSVPVTFDKKLERMFNEDYYTAMSTNLNQLLINSCNELELNLTALNSEQLLHFSQLYEDKVSRTCEINLKYEADLYNLSKHVDDKNQMNINNIIYAKVLEDKKKDLRELEEEFIRKKEEIITVHRQKVQKEKEMFHSNMQLNVNESAFNLTEMIKGRIVTLFKPMQIPFRISPTKGKF